MKRTITILLFAVLAIAMMAGATAAFAASGGPEGRRGGPGGCGPGGGGEVTAIDGNTITAENPHGEVTIITTADTEFEVNGKAGSLSDISVGMFVGAHGEKDDDGVVTADRVFAGDEKPERPEGGRRGRGAGGEVTGISGSTITVENPRGEATIVTTADTEFEVNGKAGSLSDISVGMFVGAHGEKDDDGVVTADRVFAGDERPERGPGEGAGPRGQ